MGRVFGLLYGGISYLLMLATLIYLYLFLADVLVPKGIDTGEMGPFYPALATNIGLILLFAVQHSVMARPAFKKVWTKVIPPHLERSTYVLMTSLVLIVIFWQWRPMSFLLWDSDSATWYRVAYGLNLVGFYLLVAATFMTNHFDLFGLRQVWLNFRGREYTHPPFRVRWLYRYVRHPIYLGVLLMLWATPHMSVGHALFATGMTIYIFIGARYEERDMLKHAGDAYREYKEKVPMVFPVPGRSHPRV